MIRKLIANIRRKPRAVREGMAFWVAVSFTGIVVLVWLYHMPTRFEGVSLNVGDSEAGKQAASMFDEFQEQLSASRSALPEDSGEGQMLQEMVEEYRQQNLRNSTTSTSTSAATSTAASSSQQNPPMNNEASAEAQSQPIRIITTSQAGASSSQNGE